MVRIDCARRAGVGHHRKLRQARLVQRQVRRDDAQRCRTQRLIVNVHTAGARRSIQTTPQHVDDVGELAPILGSSAGDDSARTPVQHIARSVHDDQSGNHDVAEARGCRAQATFHARHPFAAQHLADRRPRSRAHVAFRHRTRLRRFARLVRFFGTRTDASVAHSQVVDDGAHDDRNANVRDTPVVPDAALLEIPDNASRGTEAHRPATRQKNAVDVRQRADRLEQYAQRLTGSRAVVIRTGSHGSVEQQDRAAGRPARIGVVPHTNGLDVRQGTGCSV
jgi:hypothetical protein